MSWSRRIGFVAALLGVVFCLRSLAQPAAETNITSATIKSPVTLFRELLAMTPEQRKAAVVARPPEIQKRILEKLEEYQVLPSEFRELRLQETELRWYLRPLMDEPSRSRVAALEHIPEPQRAEVEQRLQMWDLLPPSLQEQFKNDDMIASYFAQISSATPQERERILGQIPISRRDELEKGLDRWQKMSEDDRKKALAGFDKIFELTADEKSKALDTLPDNERQEMEKTLAAYGNLTLAQRAQCIRSFEKFAGMSAAERQQFLRNAERWQEMTPQERQKWRELVTVAPVMPPMELPRSRPQPGQTMMLHGKAIATN